MGFPAKKQRSGVERLLIVAAVLILISATVYGLIVLFLTKADEIDYLRSLLILAIAIAISRLAGVKAPIDIRVRITAPPPGKNKEEAVRVKT